MFPIPRIFLTKSQTWSIKILLKCLRLKRTSKWPMKLSKSSTNSDCSYTMVRPNLWYQKEHSSLEMTNLLTKQDFWLKMRSTKISRRKQFLVFTSILLQAAIEETTAISSMMQNTKESKLQTCPNTSDQSRPLTLTNNIRVTSKERNLPTNGSMVRKSTLQWTEPNSTKSNKINKKSIFLTKNNKI